MAYTYDEFLKAMEESGLAGGFSQYDLNLAQQNPDAGMQILAAKQQWTNAQTEQERLAANAAAEQVRAQFGSYYGGADGSQYNAIGQNAGAQSSFPSGYQSAYSGDIQNLYAQQLGYGSFQDTAQRPSYNNRYDAQINQQLQGLIDRPDFSYDPASDPLYGNYRKQYLREGKRATADALGAAAAASGGIPSSYAVTAATQAGDYYNAQLTDKIPELYQIAYNKYLNDFSMDQARLSALQGQEQMDYAKYLDELGQYNTDRNFNYGAWMDQYNMLANNLQTARDLEGTDYSRAMDELNYNTAQDAEDWERQYRLATLAAEAGDLSYLQGMGIDTSNYWALNGPRSSGGGGGGGSRSGGGGSGSGEESGILATMLALGDDNAALEYLIGLNFTQGKHNQLWEAYQTAKAKEEETARNKVYNNAHKTKADPVVERWTQILLQIEDMNERDRRIKQLFNSDQITRAQADALFGAVMGQVGTQMLVEKPSTQTTWRSR